MAFFWPCVHFFCYILDFGKRLEFSYSATLSWIYFAIVALIVGVVYLIINRRVAYVEN